ncbi:hypothetical protein B0H11DRAFT_2259931 [Mycena galericulata]|nr:hypothetical protein B0H11DRAFT_2259931 [Mycena galericulata]
MLANAQSGLAVLLNASRPTHTPSSHLRVRISFRWSRKMCTRVSVGVLTVTLMCMLEERRSLEVLWDTGDVREFKWNSFILGAMRLPTTFPVTTHSHSHAAHPHATATYPKPSSCPRFPNANITSSSGNITPAAASAQSHNPYPGQRHTPKRKREIESKSKSPRCSKTQTQTRLVKNAPNLRALEQDGLPIPFFSPSQYNVLLSFGGCLRYGNTAVRMISLSNVKQEVGDGVMISTRSSVIIDSEWQTPPGHLLWGRPTLVRVLHIKNPSKKNVPKSASALSAWLLHLTGQGADMAFITNLIS